MAFKIITFGFQDFILVLLNNNQITNMVKKRYMYLMYLKKSKLL